MSSSGSSSSRRARYFAAAAEEADEEAMELKPIATKHKAPMSSKLVAKYKKTRKKSSETRDVSDSDQDEATPMITATSTTIPLIPSRKVRLKNPSRHFLKPTKGTFLTMDSHLKEHFEEEMIQTRPLNDFLQNGEFEALQTSEVSDGGIDSSLVSSGGSAPSNNSQLMLIRYKQTDDDAVNTYKAAQQKKRREVHSLLVCIFFLFITVITLSQILVMHSGTNNSNFYQMKLMQEELKLMDISIDKMLREKHVLPMQIWYALKQYTDNLKRFSAFIDVLELDVLANVATRVNITSDTNNNSNASGAIMSAAESGEDSLVLDIDSLVTKLSKCNNEFKMLLEREADIVSAKTEQTGDEKTSAPIFDFLIRFMIDLKRRTDEGPQVVNATHLDTLLNDYLGLFKELSGRAHIEPTRQLEQRGCLQTVVYTLYYLFNAQYTQLFESEPALRHQQHDDGVRLLNETIELLNDTSHVVQMPVRDMNTLYRRYQEAAQLDRRFQFQQKLCDAQPPVLMGPLTVVEHKYNTSLVKLVETQNSGVQVGGLWRPVQCQARHKAKWRGANWDFLGQFLVVIPLIIIVFVRKLSHTPIQISYLEAIGGIE